MKKQSIKNGTIMTFKSKGMAEEILQDSGIQMSKKEFLRKLECKPVRIHSLETYTELGDKDYEYYNINFIYDGGFQLVGISGYHLEKP